MTLIDWLSGMYNVPMIQRDSFTEINQIVFDLNVYHGTNNLGA